MIIKLSAMELCDMNSNSNNALLYPYCQEYLKMQPF